MRQRWEGQPLLASWPGLKCHQKLAPAQAMHKLSTLPGGTKEENTQENGTEMDAPPCKLTRPEAQPEACSCAGRADAHYVVCWRRDCDINAAIWMHACHKDERL